VTAITVPMVCGLVGVGKEVTLSQGLKAMYLGNPSSSLMAAMPMTRMWHLTINILEHGTRS